MTSGEFTFLDPGTSVFPEAHRLATMTVICSDCGKSHGNFVCLELVLTWKDDEHTEPDRVLNVMLEPEHAHDIALGLEEMAQVAHTVVLPEIHEPSHEERQGDT